MLTDKLNSKLEKARELGRSLDKSLAIEYLWFDAFNHGRARAHWVGKGTSYNNRVTMPLHYGHEFIITDGNGEQRMFTYEDVPETLGGGLKNDQWQRVTNLTVS